MHSTTLGRTGLTVSRLAFGAGPVSGLMTGDDQALQISTLSRALELGINWIDTAAGYGEGKSETNLGQALAQIGSNAARSVHIATKVRIDVSSTESWASQIERSMQASLARLGRSQVTLLQLHNGLTAQQGQQPASLSSADVLKPGGVLDGLRAVQRQGLTRFIGLTGTGDAEAMRAVINSGQFDTIQLPYNMLNPSAGRDMPPDFIDRNYGNILADCLRQNMGAMAIRVLAAGAMLGAPPSAHTLKTPYFPLSLYQQDLAAAGSLEIGFEQAVQFALAHPAIHMAIIGFGRPEHIVLVTSTTRSVGEVESSP